MAPRAVLAIALGLASTAVAQPAAPDCYGPSTSGYMGPSTVLGCNCSCRCTGPLAHIEFQVASVPGSFATPVLSGLGNSGFYGHPLGADTLTPGAAYQMRVRLYDSVDAGDWGPGNLADAGPNCAIASVPYGFIYDDRAPDAPQILSVKLVEQEIDVAFTPSDDHDGGGIDFYAIYYEPYTSNLQAGFGTGKVSPVVETMPPGDYGVSLLAQDVAQNLGPLFSPFTQITVGFDASVPVPVPPSWSDPVTGSGYVDVYWPGAMGESYGLDIRANDGGWQFCQHAGGGYAHIGVAFSPCATVQLRMSRIIGRAASDWSGPNVAMLFDSIDPDAGAAPALTASATAVRLQWVNPGDACPSGMSYDVQRSLDGGAFLTVASALAVTSFDDAPDAAGLFSYRFVAIDGAGNRTSSDSASVVFPGDAGLPPHDAGPPPEDAGPTGTPDGGPRVESLHVGCGCDAASGGAGLALVLLGLCIRRMKAVRN
jgi:hypothetical protein